MPDPALGTPIPADALARTASLPRKPAPVELTGRRVRLAPLVLERDADALFAISNGRPARLGERQIDAYDAEALIWRFMFGGPFASVAELVERLRVDADGTNSSAFCVFDQPTGEPVGVVNYLNNSPADLKVELGGIWYSPLVQRSLVNTEAAYLLLRHAFDLGYRRLEWKCDRLNERSRRAAARIGFTFEGIQEQHYIIKGRSRDTAWFRILASEWPAIRARLETLLADG